MSANPKSVRAMCARPLVAVALVLLAGCVTEHPIAVEIVPPRGPDGGPDVPASVVAWELALVRLSNIEMCPTADEAAAAAPIGTVGHVQTFSSADGVGVPIGELPAGRWAFVAVGRAADCVPVLYGCRAVNVGTAIPSSIVIDVEPAATAETCGSCRACSGAGVCSPADERC